MHPVEPVQPTTAAQPGPGLVRAYVWEVPVRLTHWLTFLSVVALSLTGYYIHNPFMMFQGSPPFTMGMMRFAHIISGFVFTLSFLWRIYWLFVGNSCARWRAFVPLQRRQWRGIREMFLYYTFLRWRPRFTLGHNALAAVTYLLMFVVMLVQILTGFALYGETLPHSIVTDLFGWLTRLVDVQTMRSIHYFIMFGFFAFTIHHVYSAVLVSGEERNGLIESIFTGYKFVPASELEAGACPTAAPRKPKPGK